MSFILSFLNNPCCSGIIKIKELKNEGMKNFD